MKRKRDEQFAFKDTDALHFGDDGDANQRGNQVYVEKRKRSSKGVEVVFDPEQHRQEYVEFQIYPARHDRNHPSGGAACKSCIAI